MNKFRAGELVKVSGYEGTFWHGMEGIVRTVSRTPKPTVYIVDFKDVSGGFIEDDLVGMGGPW